jgi:hypothetical protein
MSEDNTAFDVDVTASEDVLTVTASQEEEFRGFDGETVEAPVEIAEFQIQADEELAKHIAHALLAWHAEQQSTTGPPGQKPIHQQMNEAYDR